MANKAPEKLLSVQELIAYTGFHRTTITQWMTDPKVWAVPGGALQIAGKYFLAVGFYNRWLEGRYLAAPQPKEAHAG